MLRDATYTGVTPVWGSLDAVAARPRGDSAALTNCGKGQPGPARTRLPWRLAGPGSRRPGRGGLVTLAREVAEAALSAAARGRGGVVVLARSACGLARFAAAEVHQPTLIDNAVVHLHVIRNDMGGRALEPPRRRRALRARRTRRRGRRERRPTTGLPRLPRHRPFPEVEGYDEATAALGPLTTRGSRDRDRGWRLTGVGFVTSGVTEIASPRPPDSRRPAPHRCHGSDRRGRDESLRLRRADRVGAGGDRPGRGRARRSRRGPHPRRGDVARPLPRRARALCDRRAPLPHRVRHLQRPGLLEQRSCLAGGSASGSSIRR